MMINNSAATLSLNNAQEFCDSMIDKVSRTFAIGIRALQGQTKSSIMTGYLLCRIADTIEDDQALPMEEKLLYLEKFRCCFNDPSQIHPFSSVADKLSGDPFHIQLVRNTHKVFFVFESLSSYTKATLTHWVTEMIVGMKVFVQRHNNKLRIQSKKELQEYCYYAAGTVGLMLTDLWKEHAYFFNDKIYLSLQKLSEKFGEGLQLINILKDIFWDNEKENSIYLPQDVLQKLGSSQDKIFDSNYALQTHAAAHELVTLSHNNLKESVDYILKIPRINPRIRFFCTLPILLGFNTLLALKSSQQLTDETLKIKVSKSDLKRIIKESVFSSVSNWYFKRLIRRLEAKFQELHK